MMGNIDFPILAIWSDHLIFVDKYFDICYKGDKIFIQK